MFPRNNHRIIFEYIKERTDSFALRVQNDRSFSYCERRKACGNPFFLFRVLRILSRFAFRMTGYLVVVNAARRVAFRFFFLGVLRILSRFALRMTGRLSLRCGCPADTSAKQKHRPSRQARPPQGARQSVLLSRGIRILSCFTYGMTKRRRNCRKKLNIRFIEKPRDRRMPVCSEKYKLRREQNG